MPPPTPPAREILEATRLRRSRALGAVGVGASGDGLEPLGGGSSDCISECEMRDTPETSSPPEMREARETRSSGVTRAPPSSMAVPPALHPAPSAAAPCAASGEGAGVSIRSSLPSCACWCTENKKVRCGKSGVRHMGEMGGWAKKKYLMHREMQLELGLYAESDAQLWEAAGGGGVHHRAPPALHTQRQLEPP